MFYFRIQSSTFPDFEVEYVLSEEYDAAQCIPENPSDTASLLATTHIDPKYFERPTEKLNTFNVSLFDISIQDFIAYLTTFGGTDIDELELAVIQQKQGAFGNITIIE